MRSVKATPADDLDISYFTLIAPCIRPLESADVKINATIITFHSDVWPSGGGGASVSYTMGHLPPCLRRRFAENGRPSFQWEGGGW